MKKTIVTMVIALTAAVTLFSQPVERVFVSTDRSVYIAGEPVWCSLFSIDKNTGRLSEYSAVSYVEMISEDGTAAVAKIGLMGGRGAGFFRIPSSAPTGNYKIVAYTAAGSNAEGKAFLAGSKTITVFNTTSTARVREGVEIVPDVQYQAVAAPFEPEAGSLDISMPVSVRKGSRISLYLKNYSSAAMDLSLSVFNDDEIPAPEVNTIMDFGSAVASEGPVNVRGTRLPEYDGEIIYAAVEGLQRSGAFDESNSVAILSSAGAPANVYMGKVESDGKIVFHTNNIYGDRELVCEVFNRQGAEGYIGITDPFIHPSAGVIPALKMAKSIGGRLVARKAALKESFPTDTLLSFLPVREDLLLAAIPLKRYNLNDYVRFNTVKEVLVELIPELRVGRGSGGQVMQMQIQDPTLNRRNYVDNILVMVDGVAITDIELLLKLDAMVIDYVDVYTGSFVMGKIVYNGMANFITSNNYVTALKFSDNVRVMDFKGVSFPVAYTSDTSPSRRLVYWHPSQEIPAMGENRVELTVPGYSGRFKVIAEGMDERGEFVRKVFNFEAVE